VAWRRALLDRKVSLGYELIAVLIYALAVALADEARGVVIVIAVLARY